MAIKTGRMETYLEGLLSINSHDPLITWPFEIMCQTKIIISTVPTATKLCRVVTYIEELPPIK